jgi:intracellular sulfur oxidation DsrE/DsrF family protein
MNKMFKFLEIAWLVMGCIGIIMCAISIITKDIQGAKYFLGFTLVCGIVYAMRKRQRSKYEQENQKTVKKD